MTPSMGRMLLRAKLQLTPAIRILECGRAWAFGYIKSISILSITSQEFMGDNG